MLQKLYLYYKKISEKYVEKEKLPIFAKSLFPMEKCNRTT